MGKKAKEHRAKVAKRNLRRERVAWDNWEAIEAELEEKGYSSIEEAIEKEPELAPALLPFAAQAYALTAQNLRKYGK